MKRRTMIGVAAGVAVSLAAGAGALVFGGPAGARHAVMRRVVAATIDEALDQAQVTHDQRQAIHAARDRVFATVDAERAGRRTHLASGTSSRTPPSTAPRRSHWPPTATATGWC